MEAVPSNLEYSSTTLVSLREAENVRIGRDIEGNPPVQVGTLMAEPSPNLITKDKWGEYHHGSQEAWIGILA